MRTGTLDMGNLKDPYKPMFGFKDEVKPKKIITGELGRGPKSSKRKIRYDYSRPTYQDFEYEEQPLPDAYRKVYEDHFKKEGYLQSGQSLDDLKYNDDCGAPVEKLLNIYRTHKPTIKLFDDAKWAIRHYSNISACTFIRWLSVNVKK